jgi:LAS superfamily LD-carboxypeptidase LdcB
MIRLLEPEQLTGRARTHVVEVAAAGCTLHPSAVGAFLALREAAARDGITLRALSTFRSFDHQLRVWNEKFRGQRPLLDRASRPLDLSQMGDEAIVSAILQWSALPGASRHHWGTEIDLIDGGALPALAPARLLPADFAPNGPFAPLDVWLGEHAAAFGFFRPYDCDRGGVQPEPWHLSYAPVAHAALPELTPEVLAGALAGASVEGAAVIRRELETIHARYVRAVAHPGEVALAAAPIPWEFSPAARPS